MYNKKTLLQAMAELNKAKAPKKSKDVITDPRGQWAHPGEITRIPSNNITMQGVNYPVMGIANTGQQQMMQPGEDYTFPGAQYVDEYPQMRKGGQRKKRKTKSIMGKNKLMEIGPLFKDYSKRIFDPNVEYFQDGGTHKSKDGTITNLVQKPDGTKLMQVKTKDGKYFEKELSDWEYDKNLLGKSKDISINPKKWGLNDYSDYSSYNSAFRNARESNEDEFTYKGERYNTKLIPKKDSDLYWEAKDFVKDYYKNQPYTRKIDRNLSEYTIENNYIKNKYKTSWSDLYDKKINLENKLGFSKALNNPEWIKLDNLMSQINKEESDILKNKNDEYTNYLNKIKETESINQRNQRISDLDKPAYFSITSQKPKDMREDGYWDKGKNKIFLRTNTQPGKLNTTYVHELSHKGDNIIDVLNTVPKINLKKLNNSPYSSGMNQETYNYVSNPSEIEARKISTLYFLKKHKIPWKSGQINENTINKLYEYYGDNKLPYDIEQLLQLYGGQQEDLLKYLNGNFTYETKYNLEQGGSIELDLTQKEIDEYRKGGYIVEDISVPELNQAKKGGPKPYIAKNKKDYEFRKKAYDDSLSMYNLSKLANAVYTKAENPNISENEMVKFARKGSEYIEKMKKIKANSPAKFGYVFDNQKKPTQMIFSPLENNVGEIIYKPAPKSSTKKSNPSVSVKKEVAVAKKEEPVFETKTSGHTYEDSLRTYNNYLKRREAFDNVKPDTFKSVKELNDYTKKMFKTYPTDYNLALKTEAPKKKVTFSNGQSTNIVIDEYKKPTGSKQAKVTKPEQSKYPKGYQPYRLYGRILDPEVYGYGESTNGIPLDVAQFADTYGLKKKMEEYKKSEKYPWVKQEGGNIKTYRSKDGTITNTITKANGDTIVQVKTKDGKYYEKVKPGLPQFIKDEFKKRADWENRSSGAAQPVDEFWTLPMGMTSAGVKSAAGLTKGLTSLGRNAIKSPLVQATKAAFNTAPSWLPGASLSNAIASYFAGAGANEYIDQNSDVRRAIKNAYDDPTAVNVTDAVGENLLNLLNFSGLNVRNQVNKGIKQLGKYATTKIPLANVQKTLPGTGNLWETVKSGIKKFDPDVVGVNNKLKYYSKFPGVKLRQKPFSAMNEAEQIEARANFYNNVSPEIKKQLELKLEKLSTEKGFNLLKNQEREYLESINVKPEYLDELSEKAAKSRIEELNDILTNKSWGIESADNAYFHSKQSFENEITPEFINAYTSGSADEQVINDIGNLSLDELTPELYTKFKVAKAPKKKYHSVYPQKGQSMTFGVNNMEPRTIVHELTHLQGANRVLPVETRLRDIAQPYSLSQFEKDLSLDPNLEKQYNYFRKTFSSKNRNTTEPLSFGNELKQVLLEHKIIKTWDDPITEKKLLEAKKFFKENPVGVYDPQTNQFYSDTRLLDFTHPTRFKMLAEELNKIAPVVKPVTVGAGSLYVGDKLLNKKSSLKQQKKGGMVLKLTQAEIDEYIKQGYTVEDVD